MRESWKGEVKMDWKQKENYTIEDLRQIMILLRGENGCPWDREQTHESIRKNFLEETYEVLEAIDAKDGELLKEELGDVLLQVVFHARMEEEQNRFSFDDVVKGICEKLIVRHPHVFGDVKADTSEKVLENWDAIKKETKKQKSYTETLQNVPKVLPALMRAEKVQHRASRAGMDFENAEQVMETLQGEIAELFEAMKGGNLTNIDDEIGDVLFSCVNLTRILGLDGEKSLTNATEKFINRFSKVETLAAAEAVELEKADVNTLDRLWKQAKIEENN